MQIIAHLDAKISQKKNGLPLLTPSMPPTQKANHTLLLGATMAVMKSPRTMQSRSGYLVVTLFLVVALFSQTKVIQSDEAHNEHRLSLETRQDQEKPSREHSSLTPSAWCPDAKCENSALCHPCQRRFLIIIATGRSASTTLTYMMDSLPGVRMSGENNDTLGALQTMIGNIQKDPHFLRQQQNPLQKGAWGHYLVPDGAFSCVAQKMMETITPPLLDKQNELLEDDSDTIVGFKTIRFLHERGNANSDKEMVDFVKESFPCARILVNIRSDEAEQLASFSRKPAFHKDAVSISRMNNRLKQVANMFGNQAMLLDSSEWTKDMNVLNHVVTWLGFHRTCHFEKLLEFNTGGRGYSHGQTELTMNPKCKYVGGDTTDEAALSSNTQL